MQPETLKTIERVARADSTVTEDAVTSIVDACRQKAGRRRMGTVNQAAAILGCCSATVRRYAKAGLLSRAEITPRRIRYDLDQVEALATQGTALKLHAEGVAGG